MESEYITIGRILRPHGNKGEVRVWSDADTPDAFFPLLEKQVFMNRKGAEKPENIQVEEARLHKSFILVKIHGIEDIDAAEDLRGCSIFIRKEDRTPLGQDEFYWDQLIGLEVREKDNERKIGQVKDLLDLGGNLLMEIEKEGGKTFLAPFARAMIGSVDLKEGIIRVRFPEGLEDL